ncbi:MAG: DUF2797 domain-containing protein [Acidimicrobiales bacterium]
MAGPPQNPPRSDGNGNALVILGVVWGDDGCLVRLRVPTAGDGPAERSQLVPVIGMELNYRVPTTPTRHCLGHSSPRRNNGEYADCFNRPQPNERNCVNCAVADAEFASNLHHAHTRDRGELDKAVVDHLEQTNILYLAAFRDGSVKIGTSTGHRKVKRLTEQGAWRAVEVATVKDGFLVRRLEDLVTEKLGLAQSVAVKRKLSGMANPLGEQMLDQRLDPMVDEVHRLLGSTDRLPGADDVATTDGDLELTAERWSFPGSESEVWNGLHLYPARLDGGTHHLEVLEMCGRMAVLARPGSDDRFVADLGQLFGVELDLGQYQPDQLAVQDSLF